MPSGNVSLYLEYYKDGQKEYEYLKLYLYPNDPKKNKETLAIAENIKIRRENEVLNQTFGFVRELKGVDFLEFFKVQLEKRGGTNKDNWHGAYKYLVAFSGGRIPFSDINEAWLNKFRDYLDKTKQLNRAGKLSQNSKFSYFNKVKAALKIAWEEKIIAENPAKRIKSFKIGESSREFLTLQELQAMASAECDVPIIKKAFIFSALTGIRWSDLNSMKWEDLIETPSGLAYKFRQQKTKGVEYLPLASQAAEMLGERQKPKERVFVGLKYSAWNNVKITQWCMRAGITRKITFHSARHTFATLQLTHGTDIYTVSKLLGHRELRTTQVYAKVIDQKKIDAVNNIPKLDM